MKFSIVTVTYNCASTLEKTMQSVAVQKCKDYEYIIVDGASTDQTLELIKQNENLISKWKSEKDKGIYEAMNKGIKMALGDYIIFLNSGDYFVNENALLQVSDFISLHPEADVVYGDILTTIRGGLGVKVANEPCNKHRMYFCHQSAFVKTELAKKTPFDTRYSMSADFDFFKKCYYSHKKFTHIHIPIVYFDKNGISNTQRIAGLKDNIRVILSEDKFLKKLIFTTKLLFVILVLKLRNKK